MRINKGVLDTADDYMINKKMNDADRRISRENMIYIGDGITDIPCMKLTKDGGGVSVAVYTDKSKKTAMELFQDDRINYYALADYSVGSKMDTIIKKTIQSMAIKIELDNFNVK